MSWIKNMALEAKQRLKQGLEQSYVKADLDKTPPKIFTAEEERMIDKVRDLVKREEVITNPIGQLMDNEYYANLAPMDKQVYIFRLSSSYIKIKRHIEQNG